MANEIYDSTWWGNTIQTASSIGTSTEMIQGQFNLTKSGSELVTNGDFATDSDWTKGANTTIENGSLNFADASSNTDQSLSTTNSKIYKVVYSVSNYSTGSIRFRFTGVANVNGTNRNANGTYTEYIKVTSDNSIFRFAASSFTGSIDNVSVKEARAEKVEAVKCLADAIHTIGIQDIQN